MPAVSAATALTFPAVRLFVERAVASDRRFELTDANAPVVADICGRLDGIALALEFVAGRIGTYGLEGTPDLLDKRLGLHWQGRRTALPRHQTLHALLDWSYGLLPAPSNECCGSCRSSSARSRSKRRSAVASDPELDDPRLTHALDQLIAEVARLGGADARRHDALSAAGDDASVRERQARRERRSECDRRAPCPIFRPAVEPAERSARSAHEHLGNLRSALEWCFGGR